MSVDIMTLTSELPFFWTWNGMLFTMNVVILALSLIVCVSVGWTRLSLCPVLICIVSAVGNGSSHFGWGDIPFSAYRFPRMLAFVTWSIQEVISPFYSYFLLERILTPNRAFFGRRFFLITFWLFTISNVALRVGNNVVIYHSWTMDVNSSAYAVLYRKIFSVLITHYTITALTEVLSAFFLLREFKKAKETSVAFCGGKRASLFRQLALSTELRVASLALIGVSRAVLCLLKPGNPNFTFSGAAVASAIDQFVTVLQNAYPAVLAIDLLMTKIAGLEVDNSYNESILRRCACRNVNSLQPKAKEVRLTMPSDVEAKDDQLARVGSTYSITTIANEHTFAY